jgi:hypothetical protein
VQRLLQRLDHLGLAFEDEDVRTPDRAHVERLVTGVQHQNVGHDQAKR